MNNARTYANVLHKGKKLTQAPDPSTLRIMPAFSEHDAKTLYQLVAGEIRITLNDRNKVMVSKSLGSIEHLVRNGALRIQGDGGYEVLPFGDAMLEKYRPKLKGRARGNALPALLTAAKLVPRGPATDAVFAKVKQAFRIHAKRKGDAPEPERLADVFDTVMAFRLAPSAKLYAVPDGTYTFELDDDQGYDKFILSTKTPPAPKTPKPHVLSTKGIKVVRLGPYVVDEWAGFKVEISGHWPEPKGSQEQESYMQRIGPVAWPIIRKAVEAYRAKHKNQTVSVLPDGAGGWDDEYDKVQRHVPYPNAMSDFNEYQFSHDRAWLSLSHRDD